MSQEVFFELLRAGLWEQDVQLSAYGKIDFGQVMRLAQEQSVVGVVAAGLEHVVDKSIPKTLVLRFVGQTVQMEQRNQAMNAFIGTLVEKMRKEGIEALLLKGQGIAQCYERPLWRAAGDVDLLPGSKYYEKAKAFALPLASRVETEGAYQMHLPLFIDGWEVELHGTLRTKLSAGVDKVIDEIQADMLERGKVRTWMNGGTPVQLPGADEDAFYIFIHFLKHFYRGGLGLRQICDWCRLLWTYKDVIDASLLEKRLRKAGLMTEWVAFGAFAVDYLGMPADAVPFYSPGKKWQRKARRICAFVMMSGNFGSNRDNSYYAKYPYLIRKAISMFRRMGDNMRHAVMFPWDSFRFFFYVTLCGVRSAANGE